MTGIIMANGLTRMTLRAVGRNDESALIASVPAHSFRTLLVPRVRDILVQCTGSRWKTARVESERRNAWARRHDCHVGPVVLPLSYVPPICLRVTAMPISPGPYRLSLGVHSDGFDHRRIIVDSDVAWPEAPGPPTQ